MTYKFIFDSLKNYGQFPLWYPGLYGGAPVVDAVVYGHSFYPISLISQKMLAPNILNAWYYFIHVCLAGFGTYLFLRNLRFSGTASFLSGIAYMFTGAMVSLIYAGHDGKIIVSSLLPWLLLFIYRAIESDVWKKWLLWSLCSAQVIGLALLSPHVQMTYYLLITGFFFAVARLYSRHRNGLPFKKVLSSGLIRGAIILGFGFSLYAVQAIPLNHYLKFSPRGQDKGYQFATSYSMPPEEIVNIVWPEFSGLIDKNSEQGPTHWYWGRRDLKLHTEFLGVIPFLLALLGLLYSRRKKLKMFFLGLGGFALIVAFGGFTPLYHLIYYLVPGMAKFRSPAMIFNVFSFATVVLMAMGIQSLINGEYKEKMHNGLLISLGMVLLFGIIFSVAKDGMTSMLSAFAAKGWGAQALWQGFPEMVRGFWIAYAFLAAGAVLTALLARKRLPFRWWSIAMAVLVFLELWRVDAKFIKIVAGPEEYFVKDEVVRTLEKDAGIHRTWPLQVHQQGNYLSLFGVQTVGGEHPNPLKRYSEFVGTDPKRLLPDFRNLFQAPAFLNILNVKYLLMQQPVNHPSFVLADSCYNGRVKIFKNQAVLPRAWIVGRYENIAQGDGILERMRQPDFDPSKSVILEEDPADFIPSENLVGQVTIDSYQPNQVLLTAEADQPGILVFSDNHYPAWQAFIDGSPARVFRANYTFRAVPVPAGRHRIEFKYHSKYFILGLTISIISAIMILSGITALAIIGRKK
ncbi:MAG: YfhO family protein [Candidatus Edwardsbacteria bacterium]|nr:YfhO family protein [Candidatus Edwardsbacteria bacterium]